MEFLRKTAGYLFDKYADNFGELQIILPNRRAGLFLRKHVSEVIEKPVFLPKISSIQDFIIGLSGLNLADDFISLMELYKSYSTVKKSQAESFDEFLNWGNKLLQDFDELDQHLADAKFVFSYLKEDKNLALWALDRKPLSDFQKNYLEFYGMLHDIYLDFTARMKAARMATYGMACRHLTGRLNESDELLNRHTVVVFAGLNALSASEEFVVNCFYEKGKAELLWDGDEYYINDTVQEAGNFIRKYLGKWNLQKKHWIDNDLATQEKSITIVAVAGKTGQAKYAAEEINSLLEEGISSEQISVVLNEENLLIPMLNSVPDSIDKFNITMGYPMRLSSVYNFIEILFDLHENSERFRKFKNALEPLFYYKDLQKLFNHAFFITAAGSKGSLLSILKGQERIFYTRKEIHNLLSKSINPVSEAVDNLFVPWHQQGLPAIRCLTEFIDFIKQTIFVKQGLDAEFLFSALKILSRIQSACESADIQLTVQTLHVMFTQFVSQTTVPFAGEPLDGLQIMGMLETRTLDFDTVFLLSVNEGVLPKARSATSFIPHGIRVDSSLPTYKQNEEIFAYHFYHIMQRSKRIYLVYNTQADDMGGGEKSRFINQLTYELPEKNPLITIKEMFVTFPPEKSLPQPIIIKKDEEILERLRELAEKGLSPSALNVFRKCGLQYYFSYVAGIWENEEITETIDSKEFGDHIHAVLDQLFTSFIGKELTEDIIDGFLKTYEEILRVNFEKDLPKSYDRMSGKNFLIYNVIKDYLRKFLEVQRDIVKENRENHILHKVLFTEKDLHYALELPADSFVKQILLKGFADRIDLIGDRLQIIDYKSGNTAGKNFNIAGLLNDQQEYKNDYCFQLLLYWWLFNRENPENQYTEQQCGVWSFRNIEDGVKNVFYYEDPENTRSRHIESIGNDQLADFEDLLRDLLMRLFDPSDDFVQTENTDNCLLCPYVLMCGK
ncbi:MAG TPA: PD-(D/E)XK nuclease family protein [Bacteroidales bacterium]|nr:PD-(D/E)XK nuclease family protein [Bacteroidales bacterium]